MSCKKICTPVIIYYAFVFIGIVFNLFLGTNELKVRLLSSLINVFVSLIWGGLMILLCSYCHTTLAWVMLLTPMILGLVLTFLVIIFGEILLLKMTEKSSYLPLYSN